MQQYCFNCMNALGDSPVCPRCGCDNRSFSASAPYHLPLGTVLHNRYVTGRVLGEGGFGITYIGMDTTLSKRVAVKEFYPAGTAVRDSASQGRVTVAKDKEDFFNKGVRRFLMEAKNVAAFSDEEGIVDVQDYFQENCTAYIVMEYLDGENLKQYIRRHGVFRFDALISLLTPVMRALKDMHDNNIIHRDISPDNIIFTKKGALKLTDFGSAKQYTDDERTKAIILKQGYAPEEQYRRNGDQGPFTDVYALCATIYTCITGKTPMPSPDRVSCDTMERPSQLGADIRPSQEKALMRGLAVSAKDRIPDMETLARELSGKAFASSPAPQPAETNELAEIPEKTEISERTVKPKAPPSSPDEYLNAQRDEKNAPTRDFRKTLRITTQSRVFKILCAAIPSALLIGLIIGAVILAGKNAELKKSSASSAVEETTLDIKGLLSGIESRPTSSSSRTTATTVPPSTAPAEPITYDQARQHLDEINEFFFDNATSNDSQARYGNNLELRRIYYSTIRVGEEEVYISFVYRNLTAGYYKVLYLPASSFYISGTRLECRSSAMTQCDSALTESAAVSNCWFLRSKLNLMYENLVLQ